jgi:hypothetical protein
VPASVGIYSSEPSAKFTQRGVIYAVEPSPKDINLIWAGTDDGQIQVTRNGGKGWINVTPQNMTPFQKVSIIEASHFDAQKSLAGSMGEKSLGSVRTTRKSCERKARGILFGASAVRRS